MRRLLLVSVSLLAACDEGVVGDAERLALSDVETIAILELVNDPATDVDLLDLDVELDARAAQGIIDTRNGPDGIYPSADDEPFADLESLDAVPWVGASALEKLRDWAVAHPGEGGEIVEGVMFTGPQAQAVIWGVSGASRELLDDTVGLSGQAATNLAAAGPYATVAEIGAVPWVGPAALTTLRDYAPVWIEALADSDFSGTFDGVTFDVATAAVAMDIANAATAEQLTDAGMWSTGAQRVVAGRPWADLADLADASGIGAATMQDLHDYAASGTWPGDGAVPTCDATLLPVAHAAVDGYSDNMVDFDPLADDTPYHLAALSVPDCFDATSEAGQAAIVEALAAHAGWTSALASSPDQFSHEALLAGAGRFDARLDDSIEYLADVRDELLMSGSFSADAFYDAMFELYQQVDAIGGPGTVSQGLTRDAGACPGEAGILVDADAGLAVVIHARGC